MTNKHENPSKNRELETESQKTESEAETLQGRVDSSISDLEMRLANLDKCQKSGLENILDAQTTPEKTNTSIVNAEVKNNLDSISEKGRKIFTRCKEKMIAAMKIGIVTLAITGADNFKPQEIKAEVGIVQKETIKPEDNFKELKDLRQMILQDDVERIFVKHGDSTIIKKLNDGKNTFVELDFNKLEEIIEDNKNGFEIIHTHPLEAYRNIFSHDRIEEMAKTKNIPPMPPSFSGDIITSIQIHNYFGDKSKKIKEKVVDYTGVWEYSVEESHKDIKKLVDLQKELNDFEMIKRKVNFSDKELKILKKVNIEEIDPRMRIMQLMNNPETRSIGEKFRKFEDSCGYKFAKDNENLTSKIYNIVQLENNITALDTNDNKARQKMINDYIEACGKVGIKIKYTPFEH